MSKEAQIKEFKKMYPADQMAAIFEKLLEIENRKQELPDEITGKMYTVTEASNWIKMSPAWIRTRIYDGTIKATTGKNGKHLLTWQQVNELMELRKSKFSK